MLRVRSIVSDLQGVMYTCVNREAAEMKRCLRDWQEREAKDGRVISDDSIASSQFSLSCSLLSLLNHDSSSITADNTKLTLLSQDKPR